MSIELLDDNGSLGQLASNQGHRDLIKFAEENAEDYPALAEFAEDGESSDIEQLAADVTAAIAKCDDQNVKHTLANLAALLSKADGTVTAE
jgi:hypothetical protein